MSIQSGTLSPSWVPIVYISAVSPQMQPIPDLGHEGGKESWFLWLLPEPRLQFSHGPVWSQCGELSGGLFQAPFNHWGIIYSSFSENYLVRWSSSGLPKDIDRLHNLRAVFTVSPSARHLCSGTAPRSDDTPISLGPCGSFIESHLPLRARVPGPDPRI